MKSLKITKSFNHDVINNTPYTKHNVGDFTSSDYMQRLEEIIVSAQDYDSFYDIFDNLKEQNLGNYVNATTFKLNDVYIYLGFNKDADYYKNLFTRLNDAQVSLAPKFIKTIESEGGFSATFTQIEDTSNDSLKDFYKLYKCISQQDKQNAYSDIQKLLKLGLMNNKILTRNAFEITPNTHRIVISDWDSVMHVSSNEDKLKFLNIARETLFRE